MRALRREHVAAQPDSMRALLFLRPPTPLTALSPKGGTIGLYHALRDEAPTLSYAKWFYEEGYNIALPWFAGREAPMRFHSWDDPYDDSLLETGPFGLPQPPADACEARPDLVLVPLLAFTASGQRLGQGGGHYDRWLDENPQAVAIGMAWDCQLVEVLPTEAHDRHLQGIVTPTRYYEGMT
jgi:5-formyltetrahydrofolate cyclo-ligase